MSSTSPIQPKLLSKINERLIIRTLQNNGPMTRAELAKSAGVTFPTVNKAVSSLLSANLLEEFDQVSPGPGRPAKHVRLASESSQVIGITLSDATCEIAAAGLDGQIIEDKRTKFATPAKYTSLLQGIARHAKELIASDDITTVCMGISIPGMVNYLEQRVVLSANLPLLNGVQVGKDLQEKLGVECIIVRDAHAFSFSERLLHLNDDGATNIAMLDHSEGIGLGLMVENEFLTGNHNCPVRSRIVVTV